MKTNKIQKTKVLLLKPILTDKEIDKREGEYVLESECKKLIKTNTDAYYIDEATGNRKLLFKFRKNIIPNDICVKAYQALEKHAKHKNYNRGAAAGKLSLKKLPAHVGSLIKTNKYRVFYKTKEGIVTKDNVGNMASSNIAGYYDKPDRNAYTKLKNRNVKNSKSKIKTRASRTSRASRASRKSSLATDIHGVPMCRMTKFTREQPKKWSLVVPLIEEVNKQYEILTPEYYKIQIERANMVPKFQISNTAYSTITVNYDWRTSIHKDKNDYDEGFGNLTVLEKAKSMNTTINKSIGYKGGYLAFPKFGVCIDIRQTDILAMDVHQYHANTEIKGEGRLSVVGYLRKKIINCMKTKT